MDPRQDGFSWTGTGIVERRGRLNLATSGAIERIRAFIYGKFPLARKRGINDEHPLLESGIVDSMGILEVVGFMEQEFGIQVGDDELTPENFQTIQRLAQFVGSKTGQLNPRFAEQQSSD